MGTIKKIAGSDGRTYIQGTDITRGLEKYMVKYGKEDVIDYTAIKEQKEAYISYFSKNFDAVHYPDIKGDISRDQQGEWRDIKGNVNHGKFMEYLESETSMPPFTPVRVLEKEYSKPKRLKPVQRNDEDIKRNMYKIAEQDMAVQQEINKFSKKQKSKRLSEKEIFQKSEICKTPLKERVQKSEIWKTEFCVWM